MDDLLGLTTPQLILEMAIGFVMIRVGGSVWTRIKRKSFWDKVWASICIVNGVWAVLFCSVDLFRKLFFDRPGDP